MNIHDLPKPPEWHTAASCANPGNDPAWWFPEQSGTLGHIEASRALEVCAVCPVRAQCLREAVERGEQYGIHGGRNFSASAKAAAKRRAAA